MSLSPCQAVAILIDADLRPRPAEAVLYSCFGLTRAEAKLAGTLAGGESLVAVADLLCVTYEIAAIS